MKIFIRHLPSIVTIIGVYLILRYCTFSFFSLSFSLGIMHPTEVMKNIIPVIMAGILGIYGLITAAILVGKIQVPSVGKNNYSSFAGFSHLAAGLACGLSSLAAGLAIGVVGDAGVRAVGQQPGLYVGMILILIFGEALGLYGLIVALILSQKGSDPVC